MAIRRDRNELRGTVSTGRPALHGPCPGDPAVHCRMGVKEGLLQGVRVPLGKIEPRQPLHRAHESLRAAQGAHREVVGLALDVA